MKLTVLCLLLLSACEITAARNYRTYALTWTCLSAEGCERTEQVALIDRAKIFDEYDVIEFLVTRDDRFDEGAQMVASDELPAECSWLYSFNLFTHELGPARLCRTSGGFELELSIPDRDPATQSKWLVEGRELDP